MFILKILVLPAYIDIKFSELSPIPKFGQNRWLCDFNEICWAMPCEMTLKEAMIDVTASNRRIEILEIFDHVTNF